MVTVGPKLVPLDEARVLDAAFAVLEAHGFAGLTIRRIAEVLDDLRRYDGQSVVLKGTVGAPMNLFGVVKYFDLTDDSGTIKVVTERGLPAEGSEVEVTGIVKQAMQVGGVELTVLYEPAVGVGEE